MYGVRRLIMAILSESDAGAPFYKEIAAIEELTYTEIKNRLGREVTEYLRKNYQLRKRYSGKKMSFDAYLRDDATIENTASYLLGLYRGRADFYKLIVAINKI